MGGWKADILVFCALMFTVAVAVMSIMKEGSDEDDEWGW